MEAVNLICFKCKHFDRFGLNEGCEAFPSGIPEEILSGENLHSKPLNKQKNNIVFAPEEINSKY